MTVRTKLEKTLASAESVLANLKLFALETGDAEAKKMYQTLCQCQQTVVDVLKARLEFIKTEEMQQGTS